MGLSSVDKLPCMGNFFSVIPQKQFVFNEFDRQRLCKTDSITNLFKH